MSPPLLKMSSNVESLTEMTVSEHFNVSVQIFIEKHTLENVFWDMTAK